MIHLLVKECKEGIRTLYYALQQRLQDAHDRLSQSPLMILLPGDYLARLPSPPPRSAHVIKPF